MEGKLENDKIIITISKDEAEEICNEYEKIKPAPTYHLGSHNTTNFKSNCPKIKDFIKWLMVFKM